MLVRVAELAELEPRREGRKDRHRHRENAGRQVERVASLVFAVLLHRRERRLKDEATHHSVEEDQADLEDEARPPVDDRIVVVHDDLAKDRPIPYIERRRRAAVLQRIASRPGHVALVHYAFQQRRLRLGDLI